MHPRAQHDIVVEGPVAGAGDDDRMGEPLFQVERFGFSQIGKALRDQFTGDRERADAEQGPDRERVFARLWAVGAAKDSGRTGRRSGSEARPVAQISPWLSTRRSSPVAFSVAMTVAMSPS